ncbi:MAG: HAD family hydrolase [Longibaculum muris]|uniref:Putative hydrolase of the HAD superfamily n=1 Tax=Longibaculum muris TaxID=1796628 RepID=A0A4R3Z7Y1_9FIRM|nr:HAD family hydrolase [Longibaculum muris]MBS5368697.1 HAD family hydrolase [Coprobacillus cateniformis]MCR1887559.1 HAD family hydrolase [Longibaculum muris]MED9811470.1 HAD family hydrolase [Longibaculum muris]TCW00722.1 putative hydrolase of the HAD superfamily [Longibaculum muris]
MLKAIFIDHMGTLVYEQSEYLEALLKKCVEHSDEKDPQKIADLWQKKHDALLKKYNGENFKKEYDIVLEAFDDLKAEINLEGDSHEYCDLLVQHWLHTPAYDDAYDFFEQCPLPIYIITNNDTCYVEESMKLLELKPKGIISSETTHYYKPAKEMFEKALAITKLNADEAIYIGDSLNKDMEAAKAVGIRAFLIGKEKTDDPDIQSLESLLDVFQYL